MSRCGDAVGPRGRVHGAKRGGGRTPAQTLHPGCDTWAAERAYRRAGHHGGRRGIRVRRTVAYRFRHAQCAPARPLRPRHAVPSRPRPGATRRAGGSRPEQRRQPLIELLADEVGATAHLVAQEDVERVRALPVVEPRRTSACIAFQVGQLDQITAGSAGTAIPAAQLLRPGQRIEVSEVAGAERRDLLGRLVRRQRDPPGSRMTRRSAPPPSSPRRYCRELLFSPTHDDTIRRSRSVINSCPGLALPRQPIRPPCPSVNPPVSGLPRPRRTCRRRQLYRPRRARAAERCRP
jgi:hypothetical protein